VGEGRLWERSALSDLGGRILEGPANDVCVRPNDRQTFLLLGAVKNQISVGPGYLVVFNYCG
jgi:hypothetical protein